MPGEYRRQADTYLDCILAGDGAGKDADGRTSDDVDERPGG
jgi:hypothetical protein